MIEDPRITALEATNAEQARRIERLTETLRACVAGLERGVRWADETPKDDWMAAFDNLYSGVSDALNKARAALEDK